MGKRVKLKDLKFEQIENYDPLNSKSNSYGMVKEWVARNSWGNAVAFGNTKKECMEDARTFIERENRNVV